MVPCGLASWRDCNLDHQRYIGWKCCPDLITASDPAKWVNKFEKKREGEINAPGHETQVSES
jgi:hypothetical protein